MCCSPWGHKELDTTERLNSLLKNMSVRSQHKADAPQMLAYSGPNNSDGKSRQRSVVFTNTAP